VIDECLDEGFLVGVPLKAWYPHLSDCMLVAVTEKRTRQEIDQLASVFARLAKGSTVNA
jgi:glycine dehydrogenase subunit 1